MEHHTKGKAEQTDVSTEHRWELVIKIISSSYIELKRLGYIYAKRYGTDPDDDHNDFIIKLFNLPSKTLEKISDGEIAPGYIYKMYKNHVVDKYRANLREREALDYNALKDIYFENNSFNENHQEEKISLFRDAWRTLPERFQKVLSMAYVEGLSYKEIADRTDSSVVAVNSLLQRARARLRKKA